MDLNGDLDLERPGLDDHAWANSGLERMDFLTWNNVCLKGLNWPEVETGLKLNWPEVDWDLCRGAGPNIAGRPGPRWASPGTGRCSRPAGEGGGPGPEQGVGKRSASRKHCPEHSRARGAQQGERHEARTRQFFSGMDDDLRRLGEGGRLVSTVALQRPEPMAKKPAAASEEQDQQPGAGAGRPGGESPGRPKRGQGKVSRDPETRRKTPSSDRGKV